MRKPAAVVLVLSLAALALALVPAAGFAAKGGNSGGTGSASLVASPNPLAAGGSEYSISGCGYAAGGVNLVIDSPMSRTFYSTPVDASGCIYSLSWTAESGTYSIKAYQSRNGRKQTLMASTSLSVV